MSGLKTPKQNENKYILQDTPPDNVIISQLVTILSRLASKFQGRTRGRIYAHPEGSQRRVVDRD